LNQSDVIELIHPGLQKLIQDKCWSDGLKDIQLEAIPVILSGIDCIIEAPTAGGKTEAVLFPTFTRAAQKKANSVQILYLAPLRALLNDIQNRAKEYSEACGLHSFKWHGDVSQQEKINTFQNPSQVLLTTPESLEAILLRKAGWQQFFSDLQTIIIDEAHNFAGVDRGSHLVSLLERLESKINHQPQRIAVTATIGNPLEMLKWLAGTRREIGKRIFVDSSSEKEKDFKIKFFYDEKTTKGQDLQASYKRLLSLYDLLSKYDFQKKRNKKSIVFGGSRTNCESIASAINQLNLNKKRSIPVKIRTHHSSVSKHYREEAENRIKIKNDLESGIDGIISTSTLELGIDIGELDQIIQLDSLSSSSSFLQRVGRTGRREGKPQFFRGFILKEDDLVLLSAVVSLGLKNISENLKFPRKALHILAHQLICLSLQNNGISSDLAWKIFSGAYCFSQINEAQFYELVSFMISNDFFRDVDGELVAGEETEKYFLGSNWQKLFAVFDTGPLYEVYNEKKHVGNLDSAFVESLDIPFLFILGGLEWEAYKIKNEAHQVFARKTEAGNAPRWVTFHGFDVPYEVATEAGKILFSNKIPSFLDDSANSCFKSAQYQIKNLNWNKGTWIVVVDIFEMVIWTFAGDRINRTLARLINSFGLGQSSSNFKCLTIKLFNSSEKVNWKDILDFISELKNIDFKESNKFMEKLKEDMKLVYFSKFAKCLPDELLAESLSERSFDFQGFISEIQNNRIKVMKISDN
jgi:ATP-dependent Lhr-like helicase